MITPRCSRSGPSATRTGAGPAPRWPAGGTPCCGLVPGGLPGEITAGQAGQILASSTPADAVEAARWELATELTEDLRGIDAAIRETSKKAAAAVRAAGTCLTGLFGPARSPPRRSPATSATCPASRTGITSPPTTAPRRSRCPPASARSTG